MQKPSRPAAPHADGKSATAPAVLLIVVLCASAAALGCLLYDCYSPDAATAAFTLAHLPRLLREWVGWLAFGCAAALLLEINARAAR